ncbi:MAG: DNA-binding protein WhiA [Clostridia bacterium]|nr:DNA-binding protein WhiA [Clostridia bacterium]
MSFSANLKTALCTVQAKACCRFAQLYALFLYGGAFSPDFVFYSGNAPEVADWIQKGLKRDFGVLGRFSQSGTKVTLSVEGAADRKKLLNHFSMNTAMFRRECCRPAYLRGVFLACGSMNNPEKDYRLEFSVKTEALFADLEQFLLDGGFAPKKSRRGTSYVLYFRDSRQIEDLLTFMDAGTVALELMGVKVFKDMKNKSNRLRNCDDANITKTVNAAMKQVEAIEKLRKSNRLDTLSEELQTAARLRMENPEAPLSELCALSAVPITRSGLNHRLNRLMEMAEEL